MRILAILIMTISCSFSVEWTEADLPEDSSEDFGKYIIAQQKVLSEAQEDMIKLRERLVSSLERDLRKYERKDDAKAVAAIKALIEAQNEMISVVEAGQTVVQSGIPTDPSVPETIFDTSTIEERKARLAAQREWERTNVGGSFTFRLESNINIDVSNVIDPSEHNKLNHNGHFDLYDASILKKHGPVVTPNEVFKSMFPKSYENGVRIESLNTFGLQVNGKNVTKINQVAWRNEFNILDL